MNTNPCTYQQIILLFGLLLSPFLAAEDYSEYSQDTAQFVTDALTNYAKRDDITLWKGPITVIVVSEEEISTQDIALISNIVKHFNQTLSGTKITLRFDDNSSEAQIWTDGVATLAIGEEDYLEDLRDEYDTGGDSAIRYWFNNNNTTKAIAFIKDTEVEEQGLKRIVSRRLLQMLNFPGSPIEPINSILNPQNRTLNELTLFDHRMLRFTYRYLNSGIRTSGLKRMLKEYWADTNTPIPLDQQTEFTQVEVQVDPDALSIPTYHATPSPETVDFWRTKTLLKDNMGKIEKAALPHREWTDRQGRSFTGDLISWGDEQARIRNTQNMRIYPIPRNTLSDQDNEFLDQLSAKIYHGEFALSWTKTPQLQATAINPSHHIQIIPKEDIVLSDHLMVKSTHFFHLIEKKMLFLRLDIYEQSRYLPGTSHKMGTLIVAPREGIKIKSSLEPENFIKWNENIKTITIIRPEGNYECEIKDKAYILKNQ